MILKNIFFGLFLIYTNAMPMKPTVVERQNTLEQQIKDIFNDKDDPNRLNFLKRIEETRHFGTHTFRHIHELLNALEVDLEKEAFIVKKIKLNKENPEKSNENSQKTGFFNWNFFTEIKNFFISKFLYITTEPEKDNQGIHTKSPHEKDLNKEQKKVEIVRGPVGLENFSGANCYQNAVIQCLFHNASFKKLVNTLAQRNKEQETFAIKENSNSECTNRFVALLKSMEENNLKKAYINPEHFSSFVAQKFFPQEQPSRYNYYQEDADEFLTFLLDHLREEQPEIKNDLEKLFTIKECKTITCSECTTDFPHEQPESILKIQIPHSGKIITLDSCLSHFFKPENLQGTNQYNCLVCEKKCDATTDLKITNLPNLFMIQLKRFEFNEVKQTSSKIETPITYSLDTLDMTPYFVGSDQEIPHQSKYELVGVVMHRGNLNYGHYISFVRYPHENAQWIQCNDSTITLKQDDSVEHIAQTGKYVDQYGFVFYPYIFFYQKKV